VQTGRGLQPAASKREVAASGEAGRLRLFFVLIVALALGFAKPLLAWMRFALGSEFYSYMVLVPLISGYLVWSNRQGLALYSRPVRAWAVLPLLIGAGLLAGYWALAGAGWRPGLESYLGLMGLSLWAFVVSAACFCFGVETLRRVTFPAFLLLFAMPLPDAVLQRITTFLQHGSAEVASELFDASGMAFLLRDTGLYLPGIRLEIAPECSGIRSTAVLLITSLVAGHLFLHSAWRRVALALFVIPLALLRNGFRVFVIGQLCVHVGPQILYSPIHRQGGPLFFGLSLIPFFLLLLWLRRSERRRPA